MCVGLLMECVHFLAHNPSPSPVTATAAAKQQLPRPQYAHSVSAPVTATSSTPTTAAEEGEGLGGVVMGKVENVVEDGVLWKTLHKGLSAQNWITKFKTGVHKRITIQHSSLTFSLSLSLSLSLPSSLQLRGSQFSSSSCAAVRLWTFLSLSFRTASRQLLAMDSVC